MRKPDYLVKTRHSLAGTELTILMVIGMIEQVIDINISRFGLSCLSSLQPRYSRNIVEIALKINNPKPNNVWKMYHSRMKMNHMKFVSVR
jgi:hypothetical protein